jgi:hypothetical protein
MLIDGADVIAPQRRFNRVATHATRCEAGGDA